MQKDKPHKQRFLKYNAFSAWVYFKKLNNIRVKLYLSYSKDINNVAIDSNGLPNEINIPLSEYGYHGGGFEIETRLVMVLDQETKMPIHFRLVAGNICDVCTLINIATEMKNYGLNAGFMLLDAGYYSDRNIRALYK